MLTNSLCSKRLNIRKRGRTSIVFYFLKYVFSEPFRDGGLPFLKKFTLDVSKKFLFNTPSTLPKSLIFRLAETWATTLSNLKTSTQVFVNKHKVFSNKNDISKCIFLLTVNISDALLLDLSFLWFVLYRHLIELN